MATRRSRNDDDDDFWRQWTFARRTAGFTRARPGMGAAGSRSLNVVRLEVYLRRRPPPSHRTGTALRSSPSVARSLSEMHVSRIFKSV